MTLIFLLEQNDKFYNILSRFEDKTKELKVFASINDLSAALEENEPDLLLFSEDFLADPELINILSFTQSLVIDNILLSITKHKQAYPLTELIDCYLTFMDSPDYIRMTIDRHINKRGRVKSLQQSIFESNALTEKSLTLAGDLGEIQQIYYSFNTIHNIDALIGAIFNIMEHYQVKVALMVQYAGKSLFYSNTERLSELDTEILKEKRNKERFIEFGVRTQVNYDSISVLIKNMPKKSSDNYTRIKDNMVSLLRTCDTLIKLYEIFKMQEKIGLKINQTSDVIKEMVEQAYESHIKIMNQTILDIEDKFYTYGLSESQENEVLDILHKTESNTEHLVFLTKGIVKILADLKKDAIAVTQHK